MKLRVFFTPSIVVCLMAAVALGQWWLFRRLRWV